jgi:hypothetical protein
LFELGRDLRKRIHDLQSVDFPSRLHVFGEKYAAPGLFRRPDDERVPKRETVKAVQVDGRENIRNVGNGYVKLGQ